jgi:hypothetical protein
MAGNAEIRSPEDAMWAGHQMGGPPGREETSVRLALAGLEMHSHATETAWPYGNPLWTAGRPPAAGHAGNRRALPSWRALPAVSFLAVEAELDRGNGVLLTVGEVYSAWHVPGGTIDAAPGRRVVGNHAFVLVGTTLPSDGNAPRVILKNSWGPEWGDGGYGYMSQRYLEAYGVRAHVLEP